MTLKRRRLWFGAIILTVGFVGVAILVTGVDLLSGAKTDVDKMKVTQRRLDVLVEELDAIPSPARATGQPAEKDLGCRTDSGDVFQPAATRGWTMLSHRDKWAAKKAIVQSLLGSGWTGSRRPDHWGRYQLEFAGPGWCARADVFSSIAGDPIAPDPEVYVSAIVTTDKPCS